MGCEFCDINQCEEPERKVVDGMWAQLMADFDKSGRVFLYASGDDYSDPYYPKYCPECGRKLE